MKNVFMKYLKSSVCATMLLSVILCGCKRNQD